jgi:hypothetical protein
MLTNACSQRVIDIDQQVAHVCAGSLLTTPPCLEAAYGEREHEIVTIGVVLAAAVFAKAMVN